MSEISADCKAIAVAVAVHVLLFLVLRYEMQPQVQRGFAVAPPRDAPLEIRFVSRAPPAVRVATVPERIGSSLSPRASPSAQKKSKDVPVSAQVSAPATATPTASNRAATPLSAPVASSPPDLGDSLTTPQPGPTAVAPDYAPPKPTDSAGIMSHRDIVGYSRSRFEDAWVPRDENVVSEGLRRAQDAATIRKTVDLGHGVRLHCAVGPLGGGCGLGDAPSKAAAKDGDTRLSMAPANLLAKDMPDAATPPSEATCVAAYRLDGRVPQGCPSDTPLKAMDAENAERQRRTGQ